MKLQNEYEPGQGIMPHEDGAAYHAVVATVSLGSSIVLDVISKHDHHRSAGFEAARTTWRILQEPRSLLLTTGSAYTSTLHGISEATQDVDLTAETVANWILLDESTREAIVRESGKMERRTRISLTFRDVLKVSNLGAKIFGRPKS